MTMSDLAIPMVLRLSILLLVGSFKSRRVFFRLDELISILYCCRAALTTSVCDVEGVVCRMWLRSSAFGMPLNTIIITF
jgi:hypothetical protein